MVDRFDAIADSDLKSFKKKVNTLIAQKSYTSAAVQYVPPVLGTKDARGRFVAFIFYEEAEEDEKAEGKGAEKEGGKEGGGAQKAQVPKPAVKAKEKKKK